MGFNEIFGSLGLNPTGLRVFYDFNESAGTLINSVPSGKAVHSGILSSIGAFHSTPGSGYFTGQSILISNPSGLTGTNSFTWLFSFSKSGVGDGVLVSTYHTGITQGFESDLGYIIGINSANRLYWQYTNKSEPTVFTYTRNLDNNNVVAITRSNNSLTFSNYDFSQEKLFSQGYTINSECLFSPTGYFVGKAVTPPSHFDGNAFTGWIDELMYLNFALNPTTLTHLLSGGFSGGGGGQGGYRDILTYLRPVDSGDLSVAYTFTGRGLQYNKNATYSNADGKFKLDTIYNQNQVNIYLNSLGQLPSGFGVTGVICNSGIVLSGDYILTRNSVDSTGFYTSSDILVYDRISGPRAAWTGFSFTGGGTQLISGTPSHLYFLNGHHIFSGLSGEVTGQLAHFYGRANSIEFISGSPLFEGASGTLFSLPISGHTRYTGVFNSILVSPFAAGTSMLFLNGCRMKLGVDYIESSSASLLTGSGLFLDNSDDLGGIDGFFEF